MSKWPSVEFEILRRTVLGENYQYLILFDFYPNFYNDLLLCILDSFSPFLAEFWNDEKTYQSFEKDFIEFFLHH